MPNYIYDGLYTYDNNFGNPSYPITQNIVDNKNIGTSVSISYTGSELNLYLYVDRNYSTSQETIYITTNTLPADNHIYVYGQDGNTAIPVPDRTSAFSSIKFITAYTTTTTDSYGTTAQTQNGWYKIVFLGPTNATYTLTIGTDANGGRSTYSCFLPTTRILMADNTYKQISQIKQGESIRGLSGIPRKVLHAGYLNFRPENTHPESLPRCIPMNFFGKNLPRENLYLSGGHSVILLESTPKYKQEIEETERETSRTVNMSGYRKLMSKKLSNLKVLKSSDEIKQITGTEPRYYHLVIDDLSDGMIADGLPVEATSEESFISQGFIEN
jgi:hypothetical protein